MSKGKFIVITGGDGVGKTTCLKLLKPKLFAEFGGGVIFTKEPGGTEIGQKIREILLTEAEDGMDVKTEVLLFAAGRAQHIVEKIRPALERGVHVLCDRFVESTFAYEIKGPNRFDLKDLFVAANDAAIDGVLPDLYLVLDLDPSIAKSRMSERENANRFDKRDEGFRTLVREGILEYVKDKPHVIVDASLSKEEVANRAFVEIKKCLSS